MFKTQGGFDCDLRVGFWLWMQSAWSACVLPASSCKVITEWILFTLLLPLT